MSGYECLKQNSIFSKIKRNGTLSNTITAFVHNVWLLSKNIGDLVTDARIINNDIIEFTKTQTNIRFNNNNNKCSS